MTCLTGYNETNMNRLLINYRPDASDYVDDRILYDVVKQFKNLYWAKAHLVNWRLYTRLRAILNDNLPNNIISMADITMAVIFMNGVGIIQINPMYLTNTVRGKPFIIKEVISRYWFLKGLKYREIFQFKFSQGDYFERRKKLYMKECTSNTTSSFKQ